MVASGYQVSFHPVRQPTHLTTRHSGSGSYLLRPAAVKLSVSWARFREKVPNKEAASWQHRAPDFKDVFDLMNNISTQFEDKRKRGPTGLINRYFRQSCEQLKAHDTLLSILPEGSEYVSLLTGVLKSIIKASCNHEEVCAAFARSWAEITEKVSLVEDILGLLPTEKNQELMMSLYANIFSYLSSALDWYLLAPWKRAVKAFNQDLYKEHEDQIISICKSAQDIKDRALVGSVAQLRDIQYNLAGLKKLFEQDQQRKRLDIPELRRQSKLDLEGFISSHFKGALQQIAEDALVGANFRLHSGNGNITGGSNMPAIKFSAIEERQRQTVSRFPANLQKFVDKSRFRLFSHSAASNMPVDIAMRLQKWATGDNSAIISLSGTNVYADIRTPDSLSSVAANLIAFADLAKLPVVSYFCTLATPGDLKSSQTRETHALIALVYALIWQLVELIPVETKVDVDLSAERFRLLDGTTDTFSEALDLLRDTFQFAPHLLYCVIDGLHWLDDRSTRTLLDSFVSLLLDITRSGDAQEHQIKIVLTTAGPARALLRSRLPRIDQIMLESP
ncbi:hypothetical protein D6D04_07925 [Aureobasidium pullulans]|nr:hypothetical protein D6D04_07925 [Aureobasidium pullulans]